MSKDPIRLLHFADAHIDIANYGRHDPEKALPVRVVDFLKSLDRIIDDAVAEEVDLVLFAGDAYKDRNPQPTFQREWGQRMMRLSAAGIATVLLVGNHDVSPASGRAHTLHEFNTLDVAHVHVADRIARLGPDELGLPLQVITVPWVSRSRLLTREETAGLTREEVLDLINVQVTDAIRGLIDGADPDLPLVLTAHASVDGAKYGSERMVMLGDELVLRGSLVRDKRLDYVALGHIHKHQSLNDGRHPPVVYPGSIERIDFGEAKEKKGYVLAEVTRGETTWRFVPLDTRRFIDLDITVEDADNFMDHIWERLPDPEKLTGAICRLRLTYPRDWEPHLDQAALQEHFADAFSFQIERRYTLEKRSRLGDTVALDRLSPIELLTTYWQSTGLDENEVEALQEMANTLLAELDTQLL